MYASTVRVPSSLECFGSVFYWIRIQPKISIRIQKSLNPGSGSKLFLNSNWKKNCYIIIRFSYEKKLIERNIECCKSQKKRKIMLWLFNIVDLFKAPGSGSNSGFWIRICIQKTPESGSEPLPLEVCTSNLSDMLGKSSLINKFWVVFEKYEYFHFKG